MIISRTPLRISFAGGGSDISAFYNYSPGAVVATAINKYVYIVVNRQFDNRIIINYSKTEIVNRVKDIKNNLVREALKLTGVKGGIHITSIADIPSEGTGMGSSSSYLVGLLNALYAFQGKHLNAEVLASQACQIEIDILKKPIGKQDQYMAAYGGLQHMRFNADGSVYVDPIICKKETKKKLEKKLLLFYTGITRSSNPILLRQTKNLKHQNIKREMMGKMVFLANKMESLFSRNNLNGFGKILHENWLLKKQMAEGVTSSKIDKWYDTALKNGAVGGKLLGAGGGGFLLFYAPERYHARIIQALPDLIYQQFHFESQGSKIIFID